ncbi:MAG: carboxymuconolactone decarboxylase family protein [Rhodobacteraceae bacterium]|nr:MAG: carboxymuconolactone decarboxylase family protein [Paracoccaceae bacterium]
MSRVFAPLSDRDWPAEIADMRGGFAGQLNVYRVMAHHPALLRAWEALRMHVVTQNALGRVRAEIVILRLAHRLGSSYEWNQHVVRGLRLGLSAARITALEGPLSGMPEEDALLAGAVDSLLDTAHLDKEHLTRLEARVGREGVLDLMATVGMYMTLGFLLRTTDAPLDADICAEIDTRAPQLRRG